MPFPVTYIWVDAGTLLAADALRAWLSGLGLQWVLFTNNPLLFPSSGFSALVEASFPGYARVLTSGWNVTPGNMGGFVIDTDVPSWNLSATLGTALPVYGWALVKPGPDVLFAAGKFSAAWLIQNLGDTIALDPGFLLQSQMQVI